MSIPQTIGFSVDSAGNALVRAMGMPEDMQVWITWDQQNHGTFDPDVDPVLFFNNADQSGFATISKPELMEPGTYRVAVVDMPEKNKIFAYIDVVFSGSLVEAEMNTNIISYPAFGEVSPYPVSDSEQMEATLNVYSDGVGVLHFLHPTDVATLVLWDSANNQLYEILSPMQQYVTRREHYEAGDHTIYVLDETVSIFGGTQPFTFDPSGQMPLIVPITNQLVPPPDDGGDDGGGLGGGDLGPLPPSDPEPTPTSTGGYIRHRDRMVQESVFQDLQDTLIACRWMEGTTSRAVFDPDNPSAGRQILTRTTDDVLKIVGKRDDDDVAQVVLIDAFPEAGGHDDENDESRKTELNTLAIDTGVPSEGQFMEMGSNMMEQPYTFTMAFYASSDAVAMAVLNDLRDRYNGRIVTDDHLDLYNYNDPSYGQDTIPVCRMEVDFFRYQQDAQAVSPWEVHLYFGELNITDFVDPAQSSSSGPV